MGKVSKKSKSNPGSFPPHKTKKNEFRVNDKVFAQLKGHPAWPAMVLKRLAIDGKPLKYFVQFYGTYDSERVSADSVYPYNSETLAKYGKADPVRAPKIFAEALKEIAKGQPPGPGSRARRAKPAAETAGQQKRVADVIEESEVEEDKVSSTEMTVSGDEETEVDERVVTLSPPRKSKHQPKVSGKKALEAPVPVKVEAEEEDEDSEDDPDYEEGMILEDEEESSAPSTSNPQNSHNEHESDEPVKSGIKRGRPSLKNKKTAKKQKAHTHNEAGKEKTEGSKGKGKG